MEFLTTNALLLNVTSLPGLNSQRGDLTFLLTIRFNFHVPFSLIISTSPLLFLAQTLII